MDNGRPLESSPPGPWTQHIKSKATALPILQHHPKMAFRTTTNRLDLDANVSSDIHQSTAVLPLQYDSLLSLVGLSRHTPQDPLSMCIPLFAHAAFSEVQFLNLMESRIQAHINTIADDLPANILESLQYFSNILERHTQQLKDSSTALGTLGDISKRLNTSRSESSVSKSSTLSGSSSATSRQALDSEMLKDTARGSLGGTYTNEGIQSDYEQLYVRCASLAKLCSRTMTLAMNKATIEESRKAIEQSGRVRRLTMLATLFIPLSFCTSVFGMNINLLGQSTVQVWWFFLLCVPITVFAYVVYLWDWRFLKRCGVKFRDQCCGLWRSIRRDTLEKDLGHMV